MATKDSAAREASPDKLPADSLRDALPLLRRPFTPEAVKFKVQTVFKEAKGCIVVSYIDARLVVERLNAVCGSEWSDHYAPLDDKTMRCLLTAFDTTREGFGTGAGFEAEKSRESDSLKRAAVKFGVGISTYAIPQITIWAREPEVEQVNGKGGASLKLTPEGHKSLRDRYAAWVERVEDTFGKPLSHGDVEGQTLDPEAEVDGFVPAPAAPLEDDRATVLVARCKAVYDEIKAADPRAVAPGTFNGWLTGAAHSHEQLERLVAHLEARLAEVRS